MANEYDAEDDRNLENLEGPGLRWMSIVVVVLVVIGFFSLAWYAYHTSQQPLASEDSEVINADDTPYKEKPQQPGGMEIEHQDATVYDMISEDSGKKEEKVEQLLPESEEPMVTRDIEKEESREVGDWMKKSDEEEKESAAAEPEETEEKSDPVKEATPVKEEPVKEEVAPVKVEKPAAVKPKPVPAPKAAAPSGSAQVQIAALKSQAEAESMWKSLSSKHSVLKGKSHTVVKADLGDKGVFYRLRVTGLADKSAAAKLCSSLQSSGVGCMPVN